MHRALITPDAVQGSVVTIRDRDTLHHLRQVLRVKSGESLECCDGAGHLYRGTIARLSSQQVVVEVQERGEEPPPARRLTLAQALIKPDHFEWAIQKATELGATRILPLVTARTTVRSEGSARLARWRRIVASATAQSRRAWLPVVEPPRPLADALEMARGASLLLFTAAGPGLSIAEALQRAKPQSELVVCIGPEGDFSPEEVALAVRRGGHPVWLGRYILRADTAAATALSILQFLLGELSAGAP